MYRASTRAHRSHARPARRAFARATRVQWADIELAMDLLAGPVYWRSAVRAQPVDAAYLDSVTDAVVALVTSGSRIDDETDARAR